MPGRRSSPHRRGLAARPPIPILVLAAGAVVFFALPFAGLLWRAPWSDAWRLLTSSDTGRALRLSLLCSLWATGLSVLFGVPLAWVLARTSFPGREVVRALCTLSMVLPPVVGGVALFFALGRRGLVGQWLDRWFGVTLPFTTEAVVLAQTFVAMPFLVLTVESALRQLDPRYEDAARTLGASRWYAFRRVTLPAARPAVVAGSVLAWARALGEFGATITFAGNFPGTTQTLPLVTYLRLESNPREAIILSLLLVVVSFAVLLALRDRWLGGIARVGAGDALTLQARILRTLGTLALDVDLTVEPGATVAVLGPNGAGKTTLLRCLAGLLAVDEGRISLGGRVLDDPGTGVFLPAERRPIGVVFQDFLLFDHLSARDNVAFGLRARGTGRAEARRQADHLLGRVGLAGLGGSRPRALSGGQQQRVALARALAGGPELLLLDEPLAALDARTRVDVRRDLRVQLAGFDGVRVVVTHDPLDAYALADRVVIVEGGRIRQAGSLLELARQPRSPYVAELVGTNLLEGTAQGHDVVVGGGATIVVGATVEGRVFLAFAPTAVALYRTRPEGSPRNVWPAVVAAVDVGPDRARVRLDGPVPLVAEVTAAALDALALRAGDDVWAVVKATEVVAYPA